MHSLSTVDWTAAAASASGQADSGKSVMSVVLVGGAVTVVVTSALVVVVVTLLVVVGGRVLVVVELVVVIGSVVVEVTRVDVVVDVVVDAGFVTDTAQPVPVAGVIGVELVSYRWLTVSPMDAVALAVATTLKVISATLTTPFGESKLELWNAAMLVVPGVGVFVVGVPENSVVFPPATDATVTSAGSYVSVTEYAPSAVVGPTSIVSSVTNCWPACAIAGQERVA